MMLKQLFLPLVLSLTVIPVLAATGPVVPMFVDVEVRITDHEKKIYLAEVLIPRNQEVIDNKLRTVMMNMTCPPGINGISLPYREGIRIAINANASIEKSVFLDAHYLVASPMHNGTVDAGLGCKRENVTSSERFSNASKPLMREGEKHDMINEDVMVSLSIKGIYVTPPEGKVPGFFYRH
ncbi:MAG: hypothetical protein ACOH2B_12260 [Burkholderiaceae bacterium]